MHAKDWFLVLIGFFIPPIPVFIKRGFFSADFLINILLCLLGVIPGMLHSFYIISLYPYRETYSALGGDGHNNRVDDYGSTH
ncbi:plasma membrane proteolipid 3 [[Candida] anglica]|uniref:Plasma membrane proteolipid 3 n=1 Tax=[Candida] anglica TaxID=148631 RepID=A0ABP0E8U3_9ASCO